MSRLLPLLVVLVLALGCGFLAAAHPGQASLDWGGWRVDTSAAAVAIMVLGLSIVAAAVWRLVGWLAGVPARGARARGQAQRREAIDSLTRGFLALAAGETEEAARQSRRAFARDGAAPALSQLLAAQAAEARGDDGSAQAAYAALLNMPEGRSAGQRGLRRLALRRGEAAQANPHPEPGPPPEPEPPLSLGG